MGSTVTGSSTSVTSFSSSGAPSSGGSSSSSSSSSSSTPSNIVKSPPSSNLAPTYGQGWMDTGSVGSSTPSAVVAAANIGVSQKVTSFDIEGKPVYGGIPTPAGYVPTSQAQLKEQMLKSSTAQFAPGTISGAIESAKSSGSDITASQVQAKEITSQQMQQTIQEQNRLTMLTSPTAQWADEKTFQAEITKAAPFAPVGTEFTGTIVPTFEEQQKAQKL